MSFRTVRGKEGRKQNQERTHCCLCWGESSADKMHEPECRAETARVSVLSKCVVDTVTWHSHAQDHSIAPHKTALLLHKDRAYQDELALSPVRRTHSPASLLPCVCSTSCSAALTLPPCSTVYNKCMLSFQGAAAPSSESQSSQSQLFCPGACVFLELNKAPKDPSSNP